MGYCGGTEKDADAQRERMLLPQWRNRPTWAKNSPRKGRGRDDRLYLKQPRAMEETSLPGIWFAKGRGWEFAHNYALVVLTTPSAFHPSVHVKRSPSHILSSTATCKGRKPVAPITEMGNQGEMIG